jgi:hypothetical protein
LPKKKTSKHNTVAGGDGGESAKKTKNSEFNQQQRPGETSHNPRATSHAHLLVVKVRKIKHARAAAKNARVMNIMKDLIMETKQH